MGKNNKKNNNSSSSNNGGESPAKAAAGASSDAMELEVSPCTWKAKGGDKSPHNHIAYKPTGARVLDTILGHIGNTPLVKLQKIPSEDGVECDVLAKCEFFNAGGSVKDRIGKRMIEEAERSGRIKPGDTLIEPTSGNTGIGLALAAAIKGYRMIITLPEKMSDEKVNVLKALGAEIIRTPTEAAFDSPDSHIGVAKRLNEEIPTSHILDQYSNPGNPLAHYDGTAEEILEATEGKVDMVVIGAGTGGTIAGIARKIKEKLPKCIVVGVDPHGSILAEPASLNSTISSYAVEGIGYDFVPRVLDRSIIDKWYKSSDKPSFLMSRRLIRQEGLLCGGSSGTNVYCALQACKDFGLKKGQRCVVILPDSTRNYMTKFLSDDWMIKNGFMDRPAADLPKDWWASKCVSDLRLQTPVTINPAVTCKEAVSILQKTGFDQLPVIDEDGATQGMVTEGNIMAKLVSKRILPSDPVTKVMYSQFQRVSLSTTLGELSRIFDKDHYALVHSTQRCFKDKDTITERSFVYGIVTRIDLLNFISSSA